MLFTNMKEQVMQKIISNVEILIHTMIVFKIEIVFWVVVKIS